LCRRRSAPYGTSHFPGNFRRRRTPICWFNCRSSNDLPESTLTTSEWSSCRSATALWYNSVTSILFITE
jgi:hypothetical protein